MFGRRLSGYELISQLGARLEASPGPEDVAGTVASAVRAGLGARWVRVSLGQVRERPVASAGIALTAPDDPVLHVPLVHGPDVVGAIDCGAKAEGRYSGADQELLATLGRQAALPIRNSQLSTELSRRFDELAESRARLVHAEAAGRRRLERDIHDGVQQELVAVLARLGLARNQLRRDKDLAETTLKDVLSDGRRALESLQELVRGIHPPILTDRGLLDAVRERAARLPIAAEVHSDGLPPDARFGPDIEGAAYFFVCEALGNILKHASATKAIVCLQSVAGPRARPTPRSAMACICQNPRSRNTSMPSSPSSGCRRNARSAAASSRYWPTCVTQTGGLEPGSVPATYAADKVRAVRRGHLGGVQT